MLLKILRSSRATVSVKYLLMKKEKNHLVLLSYHHRSKPICNSLIGHAFLERVVKDMIADAIARLRMNNQAAVYINDEKNAREPTNLSVPIPAIPLIPERGSLGRPVSIRENRTFSDVLLVMGTVLDPHIFPTIKDRPRQQRYHNIDREDIESFTRQINGNLKQAYTVIKSENASFTHIDVHFATGGANSAAKLESAAMRKRKEYRVAHEYMSDTVSTTSSLAKSFLYCANSDSE